MTASFTTTNRILQFFGILMLVRAIAITLQNVKNKKGKAKRILVVLVKCRHIVKLAYLAVVT